MPRKKVDNRIRLLIENGVASRQRSMFVVVGERAKDQVVLLHHMLAKAVVKARPSVLWCYKKDLGFSRCVCVFVVCCFCVECACACAC